MKKRVYEFDALGFDPYGVANEDDDIAANHVSKKNARVKGLEVVFDPAGHRYSWWLRQS